MCRSFSRCAVILLLAAGALSCTDTSTAPPSGHAARLAFVPRFSDGAAAIYESLSSFALDVDNIRITIRSLGPTGEELGEVLKDTTVAFPATANEITVVIELTLPVAEQSVAALVQMRVGTVSYFEGTQTLVARQGETTGNPEPVSMTYVGPGASAAFLSVNPFRPTLAPSATLQFGATAYDQGEHVVADLPISWSSSDASVATISATGLATSTGKIGTATITAKGLNGISQPATLNVLPVAALVVVSGDKQSDVAGAVLAAPLTVEAFAANQEPVIGVVGEARGV